MITDPHGANLRAKRVSPSYRDEASQALLAELQQAYDTWRRSTLEVDEVGEAAIPPKVRLLNEYKDLIDQRQFAEAFDSRSRLHSSVIEEFLSYLFLPVVSGAPTVIGTGSGYRSQHFDARTLGELLNTPSQVVELKDLDFLIGADVRSVITTVGSASSQETRFTLPLVAIEAKTYVDKTMLGEISAAAEEIKRAIPGSRYFVVAEYLKLTDGYQFGGSKVDQVYILRRQKNVDREFRLADDFERNPIQEDLIMDLYREVVTFLGRTPEAEIESRLTRGKLL